VAAGRGPDGADHLPERHRLGAYRVDGGILDAAADGQPGQVIDVDGPDPVLAAAADREDRQVAQQPRDVVDEHVASAEQDRRAENRVRDAGAPQVLLDLGLAREVRERRAQVGVGDGDMHDPLDPGPPGRVEQDTAVGHRLGVGVAAAGKPDPVGVVQGVHAVQRPGQLILVAEIQRAHLDVTGFGGRVTGQGTNPVTGGLKVPRDRRARVAERTGHNI
jgi:hypothetical protein